MAITAFSRQKSDTKKTKIFRKQKWIVGQYSWSFVIVTVTSIFTSHQILHQKPLELSCIYWAPHHAFTLYSLRRQWLAWKISALLCLLIGVALNINYSVTRLSVLCINKTKFILVLHFSLYLNTGSACKCLDTCQCPSQNECMDILLTRDISKTHRHKRLFSDHTHVCSCICQHCVPSH
jgi:hypothetical protein